MPPKKKNAAKNVESVVPDDTKNVESVVPDDTKKKIRLENEDEKIKKENDKQSEGDTQPSVSKSTKAKRAKRGKTIMHCLVVQRANGVKKDVDFNKKGQAVGKVATQMQSYIGILAREKVKITYDSWQDVPTKVKNLIWMNVNMLFNVPETWKDECLMSASRKFRQFKAKLTKDFVNKRIDSSELNTPPTDYPTIQAADWSAFVISRLSKNFQKLSNEQRQRRAMVLYQYRLARKGYANYASEHPELMSDDPDIDQSTLWCEARKDKDGNVSTDEPGLEDKLSEIGELISDKKEGKLHLKVSKGTILEHALGKEEHPGRVRGVGCDMTQTSYFKVHRGKKIDPEIYRRHEEELMAEKKKNAEQDKLLVDQRERIARLEAFVYKGKTPDDDFEQKGSCSVKKRSENLSDDIDEVMKLGDDDVNLMDTDVQLLDEKEMLQGRLVTLSEESGTNIARGTIVKPCGITQELPHNCVRVSIDEVVDDNAPLPIPFNNCKNIGDALGCHVTWPMHMLKLHDEPKRRRRQEKKDLTIDYTKIPLSLRVLYCYLKAADEGKGCTNTIEIRMYKDLFGEEKSIYVHLEDARNICCLKPISYTCVAVYIWHLHKKFQSLKKLRRYKFIDPFNVGFHPTNKVDKVSKKKALDARASSLAQGLSEMTTNQIALVPCNVRNHWILTLIDINTDEIGLLDPLYLGNNDNDWKKVVELALQVCDSLKPRTERKAPFWTIFTVPKQPDSYQCGFYVMKYMKEIVEDETCNSIRSLQSLFKKNSYSVPEIDEVRKEWADCVQENIYY